MATIPEALQVALQYHRAGHLREAEQIYRQIVQADPSQAEARNNLDIILRQQGQTSGSASGVTQARLEAVTHNRQGIALFNQGRLNEAVMAFQQALQLVPDFTEAHSNLGNILYYQGKHDEAVACYQQALRIRPDDSGVYNNLGNVLAAQGKFAEAVAACQRAVQLDPTNAGAFNNLGNAFRGLKDLDQAVASYRQAVRVKADYAEAYNNLGLTLMEQNKPAEAMVSYQQALRIKPDYADAYNHLGLVLAEQYRLDEAITCYDRALQIEPNHVRAQFAKGVALCEQGRPAEAVTCYERALRLKPDMPDAHWGRGLALLLLGDLKQGWPEYEFRWQCKPFSPRPFPKPLWDGSPLAGKTILIHAEQGLGDTMQFIRLMPQVKARGGRIVFECQETLIPLLSRSLPIDEFFPQNTPPPPFDVQAPLLSLPRILDITLANIPAEVPYLSPDPELVERWRSELSSNPSFKIGIAWNGNPLVRSNRIRSIPLTDFAPLARLEGVRLYSLQKGPGFEQLAETAGRFPIADLGSRLETYSDTAALLMSLDLVVSMDTSLAHCAGALGRPVWVALSSTPEWRWLLQREDSPWYPTLRLFRQTRPGDWAEVFARIVTELKSLLASRSP